MLRKCLTTVLCCLAFQFLVGRTVPAVFYVDSDKGQDAADGISVESAWRSLERVNQAELIPGDRVLFKSGGLWRGSLLPKSGQLGTPIFYGAYGSGSKPIIQPSVACDSPDDWSLVKPGIWTTKTRSVTVMEQHCTFVDSVWSLYQAGGAKCTLAQAVEDGVTLNRVVCETSGLNKSQLQLWGPVVSEISATYVLRMKTRSTIPFEISNFSVLKKGTPWSTVMQGSVEKGEVREQWQVVEILLTPQAEFSPAYLHLSLGGSIPAGAVFDFVPLELLQAKLDENGCLAFDVGNVILDHGKKWGVKKWGPEDLQEELDYWYDIKNLRVMLVCDKNPALKFKSIELALKQHVVRQANCHDLVFDGLMLRYGGAHGFGGRNTRGITIRNCDICWIGGSLHIWRISADKKEKRPVRYGNGIEFWDRGEDHLVENNRLWEIYDAALSNQGNNTNSIQRNIVYRNNTIWNSEYSFEFWNRPEAAITENIFFENNTCVDAGCGWGHSQRPDKNGAHQMYYTNQSMTKNVVVRNNIFANSSEVCLRMGNDWRTGLTLANNLYWQRDGAYMFRMFDREMYTAEQFADYRQKYGLDRNSVVAEPVFVNPAKRDYRLQRGSPGMGLASDGGQVGAR